MKKLTWEEERGDAGASDGCGLITIILCSEPLVLAWLGSYLIMTVEADRPAMHKAGVHLRGRRLSPAMIPRHHPLLSDRRRDRGKRE